MKKLLLVLLFAMFGIAQFDSKNDLLLTYETVSIKNSAQIKIRTKAYLKQAALFFERQENRNVAKVLVKTKLLSKGGDIVWSKAEEIELIESSGTNENIELAIYEISVDPEQYTLETIVLDMGNNKSFKDEAQIALRKDTDSVIEVDNLVLFEKSNGIFKAAKLMNLNRHVDLYRISFSIFAEENFDNPIFILVKIVPANSNDDPVFVRSYKKERFTESDRLDKLSIDLNKAVFEKYSEFVVSVEVFDANEKLLSVIKKELTFSVNEYPSTVLEMNQALRYMTHILTSDSIDFYTDKPLDVSLAFYKRYWESVSYKENKSDASQIMREYFQRIQFCIKYFSNFKGDGWRTDRGRIYIKFGQPDEIANHPFEVDSKPYITWIYYNLRKEFVFIDQSGFGDFRMTEESRRQEHY
jgi:GWxTD domain-containing protein